MKYIRTKDGIYENNGLIQSNSTVEENAIIVCGGHFAIPVSNIIKQADTIEELIMPCDLVRCGLDMYLLEKDRGECLKAENTHLVKRNEVDFLWIAVGEDIEVYPNFKLVAERNDETGRLELI